MAEDVAVDPYHDPYYSDWINEEQEALYPRLLPERHYLGRADGCQWEGPGFFYEPWGRGGQVGRIMRTASQPALLTAGNRSPRVRTALYRLSDAVGRLLYIGITSDPERRWVEHADDKPWWPQVTRFDVDWFDNGRLALAAEGAAIRAEKPLYNIKHNQQVA